MRSPNWCVVGVIFSSGMYSETTRSVCAGTSYSMGSLWICAPVGNTTASRPPKVRVRVLPARIAAPLSSRAIRAASMRTGAWPKEFDSATRTAVPPRVVRATMRTVCALTVVGAAAASTGSGVASGAGRASSGRASSGSSGPPPGSAAGASCCAVPQVAIQAP